MKVLIVLGSILFPLIMYFLQKKWERIPLFFNLVAIISALVFGNIVSLSVYQVIKDNTVFMTNIHEIFLNPLFLITGAYLGVYIIYLMLQLIFRD